MRNSIVPLVVLLLGLLLGLTAWTDSALAASWYVSTAGNDGYSGATSTYVSGSMGPFLTLGKAASVAQSGDIIIMGAGTFPISSMVTLAPGVSLYGSGINNTILQPTTSLGNSTQLLSLISNSHVNGNQTVALLTIDGLNHYLQMGIYVSLRDNVIIHDVEIKNCWFMAINVIGGIPSTTVWPSLAPVGDSINGFQLYNSILSNSGQTPCLAANAPTGASCGTAATADADPVNWSWGTLTWAGGLANSSIYGNVIDESQYGGYGIKGRWMQNVNVFQNTIRVITNNPGYGNPFSMEIWWAVNSQIYDNTANGGFSVGMNQNVQIHHNRIIMPPTQTGGIGLEFGGNASYASSNLVVGAAPGVGYWGGESVNSWIYNNFFLNSTNAITVDPEASSVTGLRIDNNTIDRNSSLWNGGAIQARINEPGGSITALEVRNNIITNTQNVPGVSSEGYGLTLTGQNGGTTYDQYLQNSFVENNLFYGNAMGDLENDGVATYISGSINANPGYVGTGSNANSYPYYSLTGTSPASNAGINVSLPYITTRPNVGAFVQPMGQLLEAENSYLIITDKHVNSTVGPSAYYVATNQQALRMYDAGDEVGYSFVAPVAGTYRITFRARAGDASSNKDYMNSSAYTLSIDGTPMAITPDMNSISDFDSAGGGTYWGTFEASSLRTLSAGNHNVMIQANIAWSALDNITVENNSTTYVAEMNYSVANDNSPVTSPVAVASYTQSMDSAVNLPVVGDAVRVHFFVPADGNYQLGLYLRSGDASGSTDYMAAGYAYDLDGSLISLSQNSSAGGAILDNSTDHVYWGSVISPTVHLHAGLHSLVITALKASGVLDYLTLNSVVP